MTTTQTPAVEATTATMAGGPPFGVTNDFAYIHLVNDAGKCVTARLDHGGKVWMYYNGVLKYSMEVTRAIMDGRLRYFPVAMAEKEEL